jgi:hypothetical protein
MAEMPLQAKDGGTLFSVNWLTGITPARSAVGKSDAPVLYQSGAELSSGMPLVAPFQDCYPSSRQVN